MESHGVGSNLHMKKPPGLSLHLPPHTEELPAVLQWGIPTYGAASGSPSWSMKHFQSIFELPSHPLPKQESFCQRISRQFSEWFAVGKAGKEARQKWQRRALRHCHQRLGSLRRQDRKELELQNHDSVSLASAETPPPFFVGMQKVYDPLARGRAFRNADDFDSASNPPTPHSPGAISLSSIASSSFGYGRPSSGGLRGKATSTLLKGSSPSKCRLPQPKRRSFSPTDFAHEDFVPWLDDVDTNFFTREDDHYTEDILERRPEAEKLETQPLHMESLIGSPLNRAELETKQQMLPTEPGWRKSKEASMVGPTRHPLRQEVVSGEGRSRGSRISPTVHTLMLGGHRYRRPHLVRQLNNRGQSHCGCNKGPVCCLVEETEEFRPFFTYFITTLHILITVLSVAVHGISPIGFREAKSNTTVFMSTGGYEEVTHIEHTNIFIGPNSDALVRLGATFAPCMRPESGYLKMFQSVRAVEQASGCCLRRNGLTCLQTTQEACGEDLNTWITWSQNKPHLITEKTQRTSGPVCGQDPRMCEEPASSQGQEWPNDITYWPVCKKVGQNNETALPHMDCNITGRPCCFSRAGRCEITSRQYCDFKKGHFHPEATLCSQIKCMGDACGLLPFWNPDVPDQLYRPLISLFLHAGVMHCLISVTVNVILVRGLEKLIGWFRISLLYISCGITGNLLSAILLPHSINVGPWSAHVGIFVCVLLQLLQSWHAFEKPWQALARFSAFGIILILISLLPSIDLVAEVGGIVAGFLLAFALLPYIGLGHQNGQAPRHCFPLIISVLTFAITITGFLAIFYLFPFYCGWCHYLNCIPFTEGFCEKHNLW